MGSRRVGSVAARAVNRIFVGNLPWTVGNRELKQYFLQFGPIIQANVVFDKKTGVHKGFGFVQFAQQNGCIGATEQSGHSLEGNNISVRPITD